VGSFAIILM